MRQVNVGVIGAGTLGRHHARLYQEARQAELVGVYDTKPGVAEAVAGEYGTRAFDSIDELIAATQALSVAVPTHGHFEVVKKVLGANRHVLVEKPLCVSSEDGRSLVIEAKRRNLVLLVGHVERFNPVISFLEQKIHNPRYIEALRLAPFPPPRPGELPRGTEVGVVLDLMIHDLDVVLHLVHSEITQVDTVGIPVLSPFEDIANVRIAFASGCVANFTASRVSNEQLRKIRVFQPDTYLSLDYQAKTGEIVSREGTVITRSAVPIEDHNALRKELEEFVRCTDAALTTGAVPKSRISGEDALQVLELGNDIAGRIRKHNEAYPFQ